MTTSTQTLTTRPLTGGLLGLLAGLAAIGTLATTIVLPSFSTMAADIGVSVRDLAWLLSSFFAAFAIGQLVVGPLSDRIGRRPLVLAGLAVFFAGSLMCSVADDLETLIIGRIIQALGVCAASVLSRAIARDLFDGEVLAKALALIMVAMAAAPGFSPLLGSLLEQTLGWRQTFLLVGALGILLSTLYILGAGETLPPERRRQSSGGSVIRAYGGLLLDRRFILPGLAVSLVIGALYAFFAATPAILMVRMSLSAFQLGLFFATTVFVVFGAGLLAPKLAKRFGARKVGLGGIVISLVGGVMLSLNAQAELGYFSLAICVFLFGMGLINPLGTALTLQPFGHQAGQASALLGCLQMAFAALMTALTPMLPVEPTLGLGLLLAGASLSALLVFALPPDRK